MRPDRQASSSAGSSCAAVLPLAGGVPHFFWGRGGNAGHSWWSYRNSVCIFPALRMEENIFLADVVSTLIRISRQIHEISDVRYYSRVDTHTDRFQASGNAVWGWCCRGGDSVVQLNRTAWNRLPFKDNSGAIAKRGISLYPTPRQVGNSRKRYKLKLRSS
jgi:hypothetical protein